MLFGHLYASAPPDLKASAAFILWSLGTVFLFLGQYLLFCEVSTIPPSFDPLDILNIRTPVTCSLVRLQATVADQATYCHLCSLLGCIICFSIITEHQNQLGEIYFSSQFRVHH